MSKMVQQNIYDHYATRHVFDLLTDLQVKPDEHIDFSVFRNQCAKEQVQEWANEHCSIGAIIHTPSGTAAPMMSYYDPEMLHNTVEIHDASRDSAKGKRAFSTVYAHHLQKSDYVDNRCAFSYDYVIDGVPLHPRLYKALKLVKKTYPAIKVIVPDMEKVSECIDFMRVDAYTNFVYTQHQIGNYVQSTFEDWMVSRELKTLEAHQRGWFNAYYVTCVRLYDPSSEFYVGQLSLGACARDDGTHRHIYGYEGLRPSDIIFTSPRIERERAVHRFSRLPLLSSHVGQFTATSTVPSRMASTIKKTLVKGSMTLLDLVLFCFKASYQNGYNKLVRDLDGIAQGSKNVTSQLSDTVTAWSYRSDLAQWVYDTVQTQTYIAPPPALVEAMDKHKQDFDEALTTQSDAYGLVPLVLLKPSNSSDIYFTTAPHHDSWEWTPYTAAVKKEDWNTVWRVSPDRHDDFPEEVSNKISVLNMKQRSTDEAVSELPCIGFADSSYKKEQILMQEMWTVCISVENAYKCKNIGEVVWEA